MSGRREMDDSFKNMTENLLANANIILRTYYADIRVTKTASTVYQYIAKLKVFFEYFEEKENKEVTYEMLGNMKPTDINIFLDWYKYCSGKEKSDAAMALMFNIINSLFIFLELNDYVEKNPCRKLKAQKVKVVKAPTVLTEDEIKIVVDYILHSTDEVYVNKKDRELWRSRDYLMFMLACRTGLRIGALCSIDIDDIDFENNSIIVVEKEKETRQIYFGNSTKRLLQNWISLRNKYLGNNKENTEALFISSHQKRITITGARTMLKRYLSIIEGKHLTPHKLRATCAQRLWEETSDLYLVSSILGHHSVETTKRYTMVDSKRKRNAANTLDKLFD